MNDKIKTIIIEHNFNLFRKAIYDRVKDPNKALEIFNKLKLEVKNNSKNIINERSGDIEYGCYMLFFDIPSWDKLLENIDEEDIYIKEGYGLEKDIHVTILYGFHDDIDINKLQQISKKYLKNKEKIIVNLIGLSCFELPEYDVLKFDIESEDLVNLNKLCKENFKYTNEFKDYNPHLTLAYLKKGVSDKYINKFKIKKNIVLESNNLIYSDKNNNKNNIDLNERELKFMDGSVGVDVKDECKLGGLPDGTSKACNQGDINVFDFKKLK